MRHGSLVKNICHSCKGPRLSSQHPHGGSQPSETPVPGKCLLTFGGTSHTDGAHTHRQNTQTKNRINKPKINF